MFLSVWSVKSRWVNSFYFRECGEACERLSHSTPHPQYIFPTCQANIAREPLKGLKFEAVVKWYGSIYGEKTPVTDEDEALFSQYLLL
jgi:hypothetical protein